MAEDNRDGRDGRDNLYGDEGEISNADLLSKVVAGGMLFRMAAIKSEPVEEAVVLGGALRAIKG